MRGNRKRLFAAAQIITGLDYDWSQPRAKARAVKTLADTLGITPSTAYRMLDDWLQVRRELCMASHPTYWIHGMPTEATCQAT